MTQGSMKFYNSTWNTPVYSLRLITALILRVTDVQYTLNQCNLEVFEIQIVR